ncbi:MAG: hypothetical protein ACP5SH_14155 [Syntrophobacteraceae bacterium]
MAKKTLFIALLFLIGCLFSGGVCLAASPAPAASGNQVEAVVIKVDKWAVYVPNRVFYFDTNMGKSELQKLTGEAERLRNHKALISFSLTGQDQRAVITDIAPAAEQQYPRAPSQQAAAPPAGVQGNTTPQPSSTPPAPSGQNTYGQAPARQPEPAGELPANEAQSPIGDAQIATFVEALRLSAPRGANPETGLYSDWKIKAQNIRRWSKSCTGTEMDPEEFAADPGQAREILACVMGKILRQQFAICGNKAIAVRRAASWWMTGNPDSYDTPPTDSYTKRVLNFYTMLRDANR